MFGKSLATVVLVTASLSTQAADLTLEPCINGDVSSSGNFPSQSMEEQVYAYLDWRSNEPYYLFAVGANYIELPFAQDDTATSPR